MKKFLLVCVLALPATLLADAPAWAWGCGGFNLKLGFGISVSCAASCWGSCGCNPCCGTGCDTGCNFSYEASNGPITGGVGYDGGYAGLSYGNAGYSFDGAAYASGMPMASPAPVQSAGFPQNYGFTPAGYTYQAPAYWYGR